VRVLLKKVRYMEDAAIDKRFDWVVIIRSDDELEEKKHRIGPKTQVIKIKARGGQSDAIRKHEK
jgi:hypothetical protein